MKTFGWRFGSNLIFKLKYEENSDAFSNLPFKILKRLVVSRRWLCVCFPNITKTSPNPRREEEEETAVGVDFLAEADLTPLTPATIYHFPGTFSFSSREKAGTKFPRISFRSPTLHVSGTFRHNRAGWHRPEAFAFFLRLFPQYLLLLLFLQRNNGRRGGLFGRESQLRAEINSFTEREMFTFEFRPFSRNDFSTIPFDLSARPFP